MPHRMRHHLVCVDVSAPLRGRLLPSDDVVEAEPRWA
jgi:hypothetical protein